MKKRFWYTEQSTLRSNIPYSTVSEQLCFIGDLLSLKKCKEMPIISKCCIGGRREGITEVRSSPAAHRPQGKGGSGAAPWWASGSLDTNCQFLGSQRQILGLGEEARALEMV